MSDAPRFDEHQFQKRAKAITAETRISYADYDRMGVEKNKGRTRSARRIPIWALDNKKIARLIRARLWLYVHHHVAEPPDCFTLEELERRADVQRCKMSAHVLQHKLHLQATSRFGYAGYTARLVWLAYRLNYTSVEISREMQITPCQARQQLHRICEVAREIFPAEFSLPTNPRKRTRLGCLKNPELTAKIIAMHAGGKTFTQIARQLGCKPSRFSHLARRMNGQTYKRRRPPLDFGERLARDTRVKELRDGGATWKHIGQALGISGSHATYIWKSAAKLRITDPLDGLTAHG